MSIFKRKSASNVFVRDLRPGSDNFVIKVNILKIWDGFKGRGGCSLEMVLVDQEGDRIQATLERFFAKSFRKDLIEGRSVIINTFKVVEYNSEYRTTRTPFKIVFYATTTVSVGKYVTLATIRSVANSNSWYYIACKKCEKKVHPIPERDHAPSPPSWKCINCNSNVYESEVVASFFLLLIVDDGFGGTAVFVVFDKIAQKLFKKTVEEVFEESVGDNSSGLPQSLHDLEGKEFLFKVVVTEDNVKKVKNSFSVDQFRYDDYMIQTFCSQVYSEPPFLETFVDEDRGSHVEKTLPACSKSDCDDPHVNVDVNAEDSIEKIVPASSKSDCDAPNDIVKLNTNVTLEKTAPVGSKRDREDPDVIPTPVKTSGSRRKKNSMS
ncbi:uncharacterized protein LOC112085309 [Eutrema salsugineum]|uniref:uncharacterized protein LOC112085309 n=1 Tax=Eutrema salsugineum TaxID=72664 RepID=UPI000CED58C4|nr:uncharacterized protein LOC112085309 [Eutrema salsugineum]